MKKKGRLLFSVRKLGKLDEIVLESGRNNKDGWGYSPNPDNERAPLPARKKPVLTLPWLH